VQPAKFFQHGVIKCLHAERDAVDAGRAIAAKARSLDAGRIGFQRHFDIGRDRPVLGDGFENAADG
jgi:hypothetical protein